VLRGAVLCCAVLCCAVLHCNVVRCCAVLQVSAMKGRQLVDKWLAEEAAGLHTDCFWYR
jgi:hypothetical protein